MKRFQVTIVKFGVDVNLHPTKLFIDLKSAAFGKEKFKLLTKFTVFEPRIQSVESIRIKLKNNPPANCPPNSEEKATEITVPLNSETETQLEAEEKGVDGSKALQIHQNLKSTGTASDTDDEDELDPIENLDFTRMIPRMIYLHCLGEDKSFHLNIKDFEYTEKVIVMINEPGTSCQIAQYAEPKAQETTANANKSHESAAVIKVEKPAENCSTNSSSSSVPEEKKFKIDQETSVTTLPPYLREIIENDSDSDDEIEPGVISIAIRNGSDLSSICL